MFSEEECVDGLKFMLFQATSSFDVAQATCVTLFEDGNLAVPTTEDLFTRMQVLSRVSNPRVNAWVGLIDNNGENVLTSQGRTTERFVSVVDNLAPNFTSGETGVTPWSNLDPNYSGASEDCVVLSINDLIVDNNCVDLKSFMCEFKCNEEVSKVIEEETTEGYSLIALIASMVSGILLVITPLVIYFLIRKEKQKKSLFSII